MRSPRPETLVLLDEIKPHYGRWWKTRSVAKGISCASTQAEDGEPRWRAGWLVPVAGERPVRPRKVAFTPVGFEIHMSVAGGSVWRNEAENYEEFIPFGLHRDWQAYLRNQAAHRAEFFLAARIRPIAEACFLTTDRTLRPCRQTVVVRLAFETFADLPAVRRFLMAQDRAKERSRAELAEIRQALAARDWVDLNQLNEPELRESSPPAEEPQSLADALRLEAHATKPRAGDRLPVELEFAATRVRGVLLLEHAYDEHTFGATLFLAAPASSSLRGAVLSQAGALDDNGGESAAAERCLIGTVIE